MRHFWPYIFSLILIGALGLCIGHVSRSGEVSMLKTLMSYVPTVIEKPVLVLQYVPLPYMYVARQTALATPDEEKNRVVVQEQAESLANGVPADTNYSSNHMKQIAHVHVPQDTSFSDVSKPLSSNRAHACDGADDQLADLKDQGYSPEYKKQVEHVCRLLGSINHPQKPVRMLARLELAQINIAGPMSKYITDLATSLLVRYCDDDGKLLNTEIDEVIKKDITQAVALLQQELVHVRDGEYSARVEFAPFQRRVQRHAYNGVLKKMFAGTV